MDNLQRFISGNGGVVCAVMDSTAMVGEMERIHKSSAVVTAALGRMLTAASLIGSMQKHSADTVTLRVQGNGPAGLLIAVSDGRGNARGYVENPIVEIPLNRQGKLDVGGAVGKDGTISVVRTTGSETTVTGTVPLVSGEIAEDVTSYFAASEQIPTVCALGVLVREDLTVRSAGGYLVQLLPGATEEEIGQLEQNLAEIPPVSTLIDEGESPEQIARRILAGFSPELLDGFDAGYKCHCSRQRVATALKSIGVEDLHSLIQEKEETEAFCDFCGKTYRFSRQELRELLAQITP